ncbi:MAG: hypothetical protein QF449_07510, partial [Alphaproteobacteria bacterium]|nr:hypothetical protein [Alphaproteobacteria bacterium]
KNESVANTESQTIPTNQLLSGRTLRDDPEELGVRIRQHLGITFSDQVQWRRNERMRPPGV